MVLALIDLACPGCAVCARSWRLIRGHAADAGSATWLGAEAGASLYEIDRAVTGWWWTAFEQPERE